MLQLDKSRFRDSVERPVADGYSITAEGQALIGELMDGVFGVRPSTGAADEVFAGVSIAQTINVELMPEVADVVLDANKKAMLPHEPVAGSIRVLDAAGTTIAPANYTITGKEIEVPGGAEGDAVQVRSKYVPNVQEAKLLQGDEAPGGTAAAFMSSVGTITEGDVYTTEYDTAADWSGTNPEVKLGPGGLFTTAGSGTAVNGFVIQVPTAADPTLGLVLR